MASIVDEVKRKVKSQGFSTESKVQQTSQKSSGYKGSAEYQQIKSRIKSAGISFDDIGVNQDYINSFVKDANTFFNTAQKDYESVGWGNATSVYDSKSKTYSDLYDRWRNINSWVNVNKNNIDESTYNNLTKVLANFSKNASSVVKSFEDSKKFYSQFDTEDAYNRWNSNRIAKEQQEQEIMSAADFGEYSKIGADAATKINKWGLPTGDNIIAGYRGDYGDITGLRGMMNGSVKMGMDVSMAHAMTENEANIYNYYFAKYGEEKANEYYDSLKDTLSARVEGKSVENTQNFIDKNPVWGSLTASALSPFMTTLSAVEYVGDLVTGDSRNQYAAVNNALRQKVAEKVDWEIGNWDAFDFVYNTGMSMADTLAAGTMFGSVGGGITLGLSAAASATNDALDRGMSKKKAFWNGLFAGVFEGLFETISLGQFSAFKEGAATSLKQIAKNVGKSMLVNASEETLTEIANIAYDTIVNGDLSNYSLMVEEYMANGMTEADAKRKAAVALAGQVVEAGASGALMGFGMGTVGNGIGYYNASKKGAAYKGSEAELITESLERDPDNANAQNLKGRLESGKKVSSAALYGLAQQNESTMLEQDRSAIQKAAAERLTALGETGDVAALSKALAKQAAGEKLSLPEKSLIKKNENAQKVADELAGKNSADWTGKISTNRISYDEYNKGITEETTPAAENPSPAVAKAVSTTENTPATEIVSEGKIEASENAKVTIERDGKEVEVKPRRIASLENGKMTVELEGGEVVDAGEINYEASGVGLVYQAAIDMSTRVGGFNTDTANVFVKGYDPKAGLTAAEYVHGFSDAYRFGAMGYPAIELESGVYTSKLTDEQRTTAYNFGKAFGNEKVANKQAKIASTDTINADKNANKGKKKGKLHFDGSVANKNLTERQRASLKGLRVIAESLGVDIYVFESPIGKDGKRQGANGWYDPSDNSIHIDLYAGANGDSLMLFTAAHELTHFIREWSPAKFKTFADFLLNEYGTHGKSVEELVRNKMEVLKENGRITADMTEEQAYDLAYEEVIADSCEAMLTDSNAIAKLAELKAKDKTLWDKIKDFITKLVARITKAYEGLHPDPVEGRYVREMRFAAERLQNLWTEALVDAGENFTAAEKTMIENGIEVNSETESASLMSVRYLLDDVQHQKVAEALSERFGVTEAEAKEWLKAETSLASLILNPKYSQYLDYVADPNEQAIKSNSDYPQGTVDFSNICKKRRDFTEVMNRVLRNFPNHVFEATDLAKIRTIMMQEGMEVACGICYVEDRRQLDSIVAQDFIDSLDLYRKGSKTRPDGKAFNANQLKALKLIEGDSYTPSIYELISLEGRNSLKAKNPAMEEAWVKFNNARGMQSVRLLLNDAEYNRQILKYTPAVVKRKNDLGGLRIYSFSDAEMFHLIDIIQVITDSATVGLSLQGYTKVNEYAKAVKDTGEKLNRSLIPKGDLGYHIEDGKVVLDFDTVEGIDINHPDFFDNIDNPNVGNIVIGINATQIRAAMTSKFIDQIIPFHTGQSNEVLGEKGIAAWANYKDFQSERDLSTGKKSSHQINIYTEVIQAAEAEGKPITNKVEFVNKFLEVCKENNLEPRFSEFLNVDENGNYIYTEGYHKFLVDFKTFDQNTGEYLPQMPVKPIFDNAYITQLLKDYVKSQKAKDAELSKAMPKVLDRITKEIVNSKEVKFSERKKKIDDTVDKAIKQKGDLGVKYNQEQISEFPTDIAAIVSAASEGRINLAGKYVAISGNDIWHEYRNHNDAAKEAGRRQLPQTIESIKESVMAIYSPDIVESLFTTNQNPTQRQSFAYAKKSPNGYYIVVEAVGGKSNPNVVPVMILQFTEEKWDDMVSSGITLGELLFENDAKKRNSLDVELNKKNRVIVAQFASEEAIANTPHSPRSDDIIPQSDDSVKRKFSDGASYAPTFYSDRNPDSVSNRSLLANALESVAQNDIERDKLKEYKGKIALIESEQAKLSDLRGKIKDLSFAKGPRDTAAIKKLQFEANQTANRINTYDRQLLNLESTKALKGVLEREKQMAYKRAEQKGKEALERYKEKAADTQRELITHYQESRKKGVEGRRKTEMRHKIKDVVHRLDKLLNHGTKERNVKTEMSEFVRTVLEMTDMLFATDDELITSGIKSTARENEKRAIERFNALYEEYHSYDDSVTENKEKRAELRKEMNEIKKVLSELLDTERARINNAKASNIFDNLIKEIENISTSQNEYIRNAFDEDKIEFIKDLKSKVGNTLVKDMTLTQLEVVYKALRVVETTVAKSNKLFGHKDDQTVDMWGASAVREIKAHGEKKLISEVGKDVSNLIGWNNLKPIYLAERLGSATLQRLMNDVLKAESEWAKYVAEAEKFVAEAKKKHGYKKWDFQKKWEFNTGTGLTYELDLGLMMTLYAYAQRGETAMNHLRNDGFAFDKLKVKKSIITYELNDTTAYKVTDEAMLKIGKILTDEQKLFVSEMQKYLSDVLGARGNIVSEQLVGIPLFNETNYLPIRAEGAYLERKRLKDEGNIKIKNRGMTKPTNENARNTIILSDFLTLCTEHMVEMNEYAAFTLPLENFYKVYNWQNKSSEDTNKVGVIPALDNAYGKGTAVKAIDQLLKDLNGGARGDYREGIANKAIASFKKAKVMFSASVIIQQPSSILRAQAMISPKYFFGIKDTYNKSSHRSQWEELKKYAPVAVIKEMGYFDVGMGQSTAKWIAGDKTWRDVLDDFTSKGAALADEITWIAIWKAVKRETIHKNPSMNPKSEEFLELAGERFEDIIRHTQVYDSTLARSANMRSKNAYMKMLTSFLAEPTTSINMREMALRSKDKTRIARTTAAVYASSLLNAILVALPYAARDDDDEETYLEKYFSALASSFANNINPINSLPFLKDIWSLAVGYDVERSDMSLASDLIDDLTGMVKSAVNQDMDELTSYVIDMVGDLSNFTGIPVKNAVREVTAVINWVKTITKDVGERDNSWLSFADELVETLKNEVPVWGWFPDESKGDKLYDAIIKGDTAYIDRLKSGYKSESSFDSAIRKALRENDSRIKEAAKAVIEGDIGEYDRLRNEIVGEGNFSEKNIKAAIASEVEKMKPDETEDDTSEDSEGKVESAYKMEWLYSEITTGDTVTANRMKEEMINTHMANGKTRTAAEASFNSSFSSYLNKQYAKGTLSDSEAKKMLVKYAGKTEDEAASKVRHWAFKLENPKYADFDEYAVNKYYDGYYKDGKLYGKSAQSYGISLDVYAEYIRGKSGLSKKEDIMYVINTLPLTKTQKDALYYLNGWEKSTLHEAPWR